MVKTTIKMTPLAMEKLKEIVNGSKKKIDSFFDNIDKYLKEKDYNLFIKGDDDNFYYKKCENIYLIFIILDKNTIGVVDFITEVEFKKIKRN